MGNKNLPVYIGLLILLFIGTGMLIYPYSWNGKSTKKKENEPYLLITGIAQDAGYPQAGCQKKCCKIAFEQHEVRQHPVSISVVAPSGDWWMFEATPDIKYQIELTLQSIQEPKTHLPSGIFLSHAHIGHYTGLMQFGREAIGAQNQQVFVLPKMAKFLEQNGPWDQLVTLKNIQLRPIGFDNQTYLTDQISVMALQVPHRDEYSETAGFFITGPSKSALFIPDIDKWEKWDQDILQWVQKVDYALIDATFFDSEELPGRDMSEIPHPFVLESMQMFSKISKKEKEKIIFIHLNHTNPLLDRTSQSYQKVIKAGFQVAYPHQKLPL